MKKKIFILFFILLIFIIFNSNCDYFTKKDSSGWGEEDDNDDENRNRIFFYVTGATDKFGSDDFLTIKFDYFGKILWTKTIKFGTVDDAGKGIAVDSSGNICISATLAPPPTNIQDIYTFKYYPNGSMFWTIPNIYNSGGIDIAERITIDIFDDIYVTGRDSNIGELIICKSFKDGSLLLSNTDSMGYHGYGICTDNSGYVYVAGYVINTDRDFYISKYDPGTLISIGSDTIDINNQDVASGIAIDNSNNIYVTGVVNNDYIYTLKYDVNLNQNLSQSWPVTENYITGTGTIDMPEDITVDNDGNVYITGYTYNNDVFIIKYNSTGIKLWERFFGTTSGDDKGYGIAVDEFGSLYVTGTTNSFNTDYDIFIIKYDSEGNQAWSNPMIFNYGGDEEARDIAISYE